MQSLKFYLPHTLLSGSDWRMCTTKWANQERGRQASRKLDKKKKGKGNKVWSGVSLENTQPSWRVWGFGDAGEHETEEINWRIHLGLGKEYLGI